ncbi:unnamed protein product [Haemonchus placei]|uniref:Sema domain-containing protein n=1 Tax=Haemonchus placei TaxID=6290 RepID=A0A0N4WQM1_HAEPC|nr:unnamed protein product [Haemonchus placei]
MANYSTKDFRSFPYLSMKHISYLPFLDNVFTRGDLDYRNLVLDANSASLYVGARGRIFRLWAYNVNDTSENLFADLRVTVPSPELSECRALGNSAEECQPSTRFMALTDNRERLYVCSAVAMRPEIRVLDAVTLRDRQEPRTEIGICAPDANVNATAVIVEWGNPSELPSVYSGIRTGMAGENHLIYRPALVDKGKEVHSSLRTVYTDNRWLYEPQFVGSFDVGEHVYFFFREIAIESGPERRVYSRVARVCKKDIGGRVVLRQVWTSFLKARLNCSISAQYPYYFDRIQAVTRVETSDDTLFYATMSTSETAFVTSAICVFSFKSINQLFHHGFFVDPNSPNWLPLPADTVPEHRPGTCVSNSHSLSDSDLHFAKSHLLMAEPVSGGMPILATRDVVFTHIAVDVRSEQNVIFALDGRSNTLWKVSHWREGNTWKWLELEKREVAAGGPIKAMALLPAEFVYFASRSAVTQFTLAACSMYSSCTLCAVDPYCSWHVARAACYPREKAHGQSLGWISSWAGRGSSECSASAKPRTISAYPGDTIHLLGAAGAVWKRDGNEITPSSRFLSTDAGGLVIMEVSREDNADYECFVNRRQIIKYRLVVDHEECTKPRSVEAYKSCQREWCKKADQYKAALADWHDAKRRNVSLPTVALQ